MGQNLYVNELSLIQAGYGSQWVYLGVDTAELHTLTGFLVLPLFSYEQWLNSRHVRCAMNFIFYI